MVSLITSFSPALVTLIPNHPRSHFSINATQTPQCPYAKRTETKSLHMYNPHLTSGAAATAISLLIASTVSSLCGLPSKILLHHIGGSNGLLPLCSGGYTSLKKYHTCPITTPIISSLGTIPWTTKLNPINTHGKYGAVNTSKPRKESRVSGFRRDQM